MWSLLICVMLSLCLLLSCFCCFFFFKQKTAYEMRISDWSSDVCSSDLDRARRCVSLGTQRARSILRWIGDKFRAAARAAEMIGVTRVRRMMRRRHRINRHAAYRIFHEGLCDGPMPMQVGVRFVFIVLHGSIPASPLHHVGLDMVSRSRG